MAPLPFLGVALTVLFHNQMDPQSDSVFLTLLPTATPGQATTISCSDYCKTTVPLSVLLASTFVPWITILYNIHKAILPQRKSNHVLPLRNSLMASHLIVSTSQTLLCLTNVVLGHNFNPGSVCLRKGLPHTAKQLSDTSGVFYSQTQF